MSGGGLDPNAPSGVMHGDGWEMTNGQYDRWYRDFFEPHEDDEGDED